MPIFKIDQPIVLKEGLLPTLTFYHGSPVKYDQIKPMSFSAGNRLRDPSWAVFMFRQKELAQSFAFSRAAEKICEERGIPHPRGWLEKDGFMHYKPIVVAPSDYYDKIKEAMFGVTVYVYTLEAPVDSHLNMIGTVGSLPEYVYTGTPKTVKVDEITMDGKLFEKLVTKISPEKFAEIKKTKPHRRNVVGPWIDLFVDMKRRTEMRDIVQQRLKDGTLKPGDNLDFLKEAAYLIGLSESVVYALTRAQATPLYRGYSTMALGESQWPPTHKQMCDIYEQQCMMEASESRPVHQSGNVTRYKEGAYFDEDTNMWMRHLYPGETNSSPNDPLTEEGIMDLDRSFLDAEYTEAINEEVGIMDQPVMFSGDDIYVNFDKFKSGEAKTCLITGLSGSGKSTLAKKIAEKMGAYYVETDTISFKISSLHPERANWGYIKDHDKYLYKYFKEVGLEPDCMLKYDWNGDEKKEIVTPFIRWLCLERDDDGLVVCEGGDVAIALRDVPELGEMPIVFKGTSILKSMFRRFLRSTDDSGLLSAIKAAVTYYKSQYGKMIPEVNAARKTILGNHEYQTQHEAVQRVARMTNKD